MPLHTDIAERLAHIYETHKELILVKLLAHIGVENFETATYADMQRIRIEKHHALELCERFYLDGKHITTLRVTNDPDPDLIVPHFRVEVIAASKDVFSPEYYRCNPCGGLVHFDGTKPCTPNI